MSAVSPEVVDYVYRVWQQHRDPLFNERDYMNMAYHLAITKTGQWRDIINRQRQRIKNADLLREFDYVSRACNPDAGVQRGLFDQLLDPENRRVEAWAVKLLSLLCCGQREQQSTAYIWQGLKELQEIQQTGDIFFPSTWLRSLLGDHRSQEARQKVLDFLESRPDYPENLRNKLKEEAFPLLNGR
jgi:aminopeptidase N